MIKSMCNFEINISFYQTNQSDIAIKCTFILYTLYTFTLITEFDVWKQRLIRMPRHNVRYNHRQNKGIDCYVEHRVIIRLWIFIREIWTCNNIYNERNKFLFRFHFFNHIHFLIINEKLSKIYKLFLILIIFFYILFHRLIFH